MPSWNKIGWPDRYTAGSVSDTSVQFTAEIGQTLETSQTGSWD